MHRVTRHAEVLTFASVFEALKRRVVRNSSQGSYVVIKAYMVTPHADIKRFDHRYFCSKKIFFTADCISV